MQKAPALRRAPVRADGIEARQRLIDAGLELFSLQGFQKTSVREVALAAQVNLASISYYFGDKAGLYRAVFTESMSSPQCLEPRFSEPGLGLGDRLRLFYVDFLEPLKHGEHTRRIIKLHYREMVEPTGIWQETIDSEIRPSHESMLRLLVQELGIRRVDLDVQRLALSIVGMAVHFFACQPVVDSIAPQVVSSSKSIDTLATRLAMYAEAMIGAEKNRRAQSQEPEHG